jgi:cytochrome P450
MSENAAPLELDEDTITGIFGYNPFDPAFRAAPYDTFRELRTEAPATRSAFGLWTVTSYDLCSSILRDGKFGVGDGAQVASQFTVDPDGKTVRPFIFTDPPEHSRMRTIAGKAFSPSLVEKLRPRAEQLAGELVAAARSQSLTRPVDLVSEIAQPMTDILLREYLGIPAGDDELFRTLCRAIARGLDPDFLLAPEEIEARGDTRQRFHDYFREMAAQRRDNPQEDFISALVRATDDDGRQLTETEVVVTCTLAVTAGELTSVNLISLGALNLLRNPEQASWLRENPDQIGGAVDELLRYDAPIQMISRLVLEKTTINGTPVAPGEPILLYLGAAGRDPEAYENPDQLDLSRRGTRPLGFGLGPHFCIGAPLARLTSQSIIAAIAASDIKLASDEPPPFLPSLIFRGLSELPVLVG